jgi:glycosyltransferase involved in cell wall biosynthesis
MMEAPHRPDIAIVLQHPCWGGVERVYLNLARHWARTGYSVDVVFSCAEGQLAADYRDCARVVDLKNALMKLHRRERYAVFDYLKVKRYIQACRPYSLLAAKPVSNYCVARAKKELGYPGNAVISHHIDVQEGRRNLSRIQRAVGSLLVSYDRWADAVVGVSKAVSDGLLGAGLPPGKVHTIYDPTVTSEMFRLAAEPPPHRWLQPKRGKVILGAGRFTGQKDFGTLIRAFRLVLDRLPDCRLVIIGDGPDRGKLELLVGELGLSERIDLPGYASNPYSFMKHADLYVLSSRYEGLAMTLIEAMALGTQVVSTDCPSGPAEVLCGGKYGTLVPVGDVNALAKAMVETLANPRPTEQQVRWAKETFSTETAADKYLTLLLGDDPGRRRQAPGYASA